MKSVSSKWILRCALVWLMTFHSGGYADVGQKQTVPPPASAGSHIVAEEPLESQAPSAVPWSIEPANLPTASPSGLQTEATKKVRELMRRFRSGLRSGDLVSLRRFLPPKGQLDIEIIQCIGECDKADDVKNAWTRATLRMEAFADIHVDEDLQDECIDDTECLESMKETVCHSGCA